LYSLHAVVSIFAKGVHNDLFAMFLHFSNNCSSVNSRREQFWLI